MPMEMEREDDGPAQIAKYFAIAKEVIKDTLGIDNPTRDVLNDVYDCVVSPALDDELTIDEAILGERKAAFNEATVWAREVYGEKEGSTPEAAIDAFDYAFAIFLDDEDNDN